MIRKRTSYSNLAKYINKNGIDLVYIRNDHNANPFLIRLFKKLKKSGVKLVMEIPTYPYDQEYTGLGFAMQMQLKVDKFFRNRLARYVDRIITFSQDQQIFGTPTINISNGIDFDAIKIKSRTSTDHKVIRMIGVADIHAWHGYDRVIAGLAEYYKKPHHVKIYFDIVGGGVPGILDGLKDAVVRNSLDEYVTYHGPKFGEELDRFFEDADLAIGSLARHRSNIFNIKTLKNREYAARGIPFVYSETDEDFENMPYIMKAPADESPLDIQSVIDFYQTVDLKPEDIRKSVVHSLSWKKQMEKIIEQINA